MIYPRVCWADDPRSRGRLVQEGPQQSVVKWDNGNETVVINKWIERVDDDGIAAQLQNGDVAASTAASPRAAGQRDVDVRAAPLPPVKPRREPDEFVERLKKYGAAGLKTFAVANGVWDDKYAVMPNPGLVRMNVVNRLRAKIKKGHVVQWSR